MEVSGNMVAISAFKTKIHQKPSPKTLDSIATDIKNIFKEYCDKRKY